MSTIDPAATSAERPAVDSPSAPITAEVVQPGEAPVPRYAVIRVSAFGIVLGALGTLFGGGVALFTDALVQALFNLRQTTIVSSLIIALPALTIGASLLLLFYGVRSLVALGRVSAMSLAAELGKFRRVCGPLLVLELLMVVLGQTDGLPLSLLYTMLGIVCAAGCGYTLLDSRRVTWDIALAQGAVFRPEYGIGFQVLSPSVSGPPRGTAAEPPRALRALPADETPTTSAGASRTFGAVIDDGSAYADWEKVLYGLVLLIVVLSVLDVPPFVRHAAEYGRIGFWSSAWADAVGARTAARRSLPALGGGRNVTQINDRSLDRWVRFFFLVGGAAGGVLTVAWIAWGVVCLAIGPRARKWALWFAVASVALALVTGGLRLHAYESVYGRYRVPGSYITQWSLGQHGSPFSSARTSDEIMSNNRMELLRQTVTDGALPLVLILVLTRGPVKALFVRRPRRSA